ncbi:MAG: tetratricopeptide repeat protein [Candidatus Sumerlaeaceae bacterium]
MGDGLVVKRFAFEMLTAATMFLAGCCVSPRASFLFDPLRYPSTPEGLKQRAAVALSLNSLDYSIALYKKSLKKQPIDDEAWMGIATASFHRGNLKKAIEAARDALEAGGANAPFAANTAIYLQTSRGDFEGARDTALRLAKWAEENNQRFIALDAYILASNFSSAYLGDLSSARLYAEEAKKFIRPGDVEAAKRLRSCLYDLERRETGKKFGVKALTASLTAKAN